ncbi:MAG: hypothetical protein WCO84_01405 [bacterium]
MAVIDYIPEVKTLAGYDALSTISTYTNHVATAVSNTSSTYNITIKAPTEILTGKSFVLLFTPNIDNLASMQISINGGTAIPILVNGVAISAGVLKMNILYSLLVDNVNSKAFFNSVEYETSMTLALSDEITAITTGTAKMTFRSPFAVTLTKIPRISLSTASSVNLPTVDIKKNGSSIFSTPLRIDATEKTSVTATTPAVLSTTSIADDDELTFDINEAGTGAKGLKVTLFYRRT